MLLSYSEDVIKIKKGFRKTLKEPKTRLFYGVELEALVKPNKDFFDALDHINDDLQSYAILKEDGSLYGETGEGLEIVTVPATLQFHKNVLWKKFFTKGHSYKLLRGWNTSCCGMHIHFSRAALNNETQSRILYFYHAEDNAEFLTKIAGRYVGDGAEYCKIQPKELKDSKPESCYFRGSIAVSQKNKGKTFEVRIFKSNVSKFGVFRGLEFVAATIAFSKQALNEESKLTHKEFLAWFNTPYQRTKYPHLKRHLVQLKLLP